MPDKNQKPDPVPRLKKLREEFAAAVTTAEEKLAVVDQALAALEKSKKEDEAREQARYRDRIALKAEFVKGLLAHETKPHAFAVFVDHTGSMTQKPFYAALDGAAVLKTIGAEVSLWGSAPQVRSASGDITDPATREAFEKKGASSDFRPVADEMIKTAALNKANGKPTHFVVISDGEFADYPKAKEQLEKLLKSNTRATIDFVILGRAGTGMEFLSENLAKDFPGKVKHHLVNGPAYWQGTEGDLSKAVQETVVKVAEERVKPQPRKKPKAVPHS
jgi:hypothetical protein